MNLTDAEIQAKIEKLEQNISSCKKKIEWYKQEQEHRKQEGPLGVPCDGEFYVSWDGVAIEDREEKASKVNYNSFNSRESAEKHSEMLLAWRKDGLLANSKGEPIDIKVLLPLLKKGYVAMDKDRHWFWYEKRQTLCENEGMWKNRGDCCSLFAFNIKPAEDWRKSLMECGL